MTAATRSSRRFQQRRRARKSGGGVGVRLFVQVMDHAPESLTWRERWVLAVLAENANDGTRETWVGYEGDDPKSRLFRARTRCSRSQYYATLKALIEKKAIEPTRRGQKGVTAHYRVLPMTVQDLENRDPEHPLQGPGNRDADDDTQGPGFSAQGPGSERSGSRFESFRVPETGTPTPQSPQDPSSSSRPIELIRVSGCVRQEEEEEFHQWILKTQTPRSLRWWQVVAAKDNFENLVKTWRADRTPTPPRIQPSLPTQKETPVPEPPPEYRAARRARTARRAEPSRPGYEAAQAVLDALPYEEAATWRKEARAQLQGMQQADDRAVTVLAAQLAAADTIR